MTTSNTFFKHRQEQLSAAIVAAGVDAMALNPGYSLTYLTGLHFHISERPVVAIFTPQGPPTIVLPELEAAKLDGLPYEITATTYGEDLTTWPQRYTAAFSHLGAATVGVEDNAMRLLEYRLLQKALPQAKFVNAAEVVSSLRMRKDESELAEMQKAVQIAESALRTTLPQIKIGMTEKAVAGILIQELLKHGSQGELPFQPIVSTGSNGANPHAVPSDRPLAEGDLLVIDFGANWNGYFSDMTRTFAVGAYTPEQERVHNTVLAANQAGQKAGAPGVTCGAVDDAARRVIEEIGYGEYFTHRTGHGLGMDIHEEPYIRANNPMTLQPGMTFTIEPGIYLPNRFGVRIEDNVVVTEDGLKSLTTFPREIQIIGR